MGYMNEFPHSRMFDSDLREIIELYIKLKDLPQKMETIETMLSGNLIWATPTMYGAKGDGISDDSDAIQKTLDESNRLGISLIIFDKGIYKITKALRVPSNTHLNLCGSVIQSHNKNISARIIENYDYGDGIGNENIIIENGVLESFGNDNQVSDQGSGISFWNTKNTFIRNITTKNTYGDGLSFRDCSNCIVENVIIDDFGRNGISPQSGEFMFNNVTIIGRPFAGANPGLNFDFENNDATERTKTIMNNVRCDDITFVDFFTEEGGYFAHECVFNNVEINTLYQGLHIISNNAVKAKSMEISSGVIVHHKGNSGTCIKINNVENVVVDSATIISDSYENMNLAPLGGSFKKCIFRNLNLSKFVNAYGIFAFDNTIEECTFENVEARLYADNSLKNTFINCIISAYDIRYENIGNTFISSDISGNSSNTNIYGLKGKTTSNAFCSGEYKFQNVENGKEVKIPLPRRNSDGCCFLLSIGFSHRGNTANTVHGLYSIYIGDLGEVVTEIFKTGDKNFTISASNINNEITVRLDENFNGNLTYSLLG